jgi:hypothetical protein
MSTSRLYAQSAPAGRSGRLVSERLSDRLVSLLIEQLGGPEMGRGSRMPIERQIGESHGVFRTFVREAVNQPKSRASVASWQQLMPLGAQAVMASTKTSSFNVRSAKPAVTRNSRRSSRFFGSVFEMRCM